VLTVQQQLNGDLSDDDEEAIPSKAIPIWIAEQRYIAEFAVCG
jgi:hypothetical protein